MKNLTDFRKTVETGVDPRLHQGHSEQTWKESQRRKGKTPIRSGENFNYKPVEARVDKAEKNKQLTVDGTLWGTQLSHHEFPPVVLLR